MNTPSPLHLSKSQAQTVAVRSKNAGAPGFAAPPASELSEEERGITDSDKAARVGLWVLGIGLGGFLLWAALAPLDEGVPTQGMVSIETKRHTVQHLQGGMVQEVLVQEGQMVKEGQLLVRLNDSTVRANFEAARQNLAALRENVIAQQAVLQGLKNAEKNRSDQLRLIEQELAGVRGLVKDGFAPVVQQLQLDRQQAEILTSISDLRTNQQRTEQALLELQHQIRAAQQRLSATEQELQRVEIRSSANGQVVGLTIPAVGAVIQPAQRIMDIVPQGENLTIEAQVAPHFIDRIAKGDMVDVRFSSFVGDPQLVVEGQLNSISSDVLTDPATMQPYYLARVHLTEEGLKKLGNRTMQPGMPAEVIIKTGSRTMLNYLVHPLTKRVAASLKEE
ncbi:MAG: HlyD family efflux transporter periplasmic adaptor subunit [Burkholderiaceae bacterium]